MKDIFDPEVMESTKEIWGLDEEDEMCGVYRPSGHPAVIPPPQINSSSILILSPQFWFAAGDFADSRFCSKQLVSPTLV